MTGHEPESKPLPAEASKEPSPRLRTFLPSRDPIADLPEDASKECLRMSLVTAADTITRLRKERDEAARKLDGAATDLRYERRLLAEVKVERDNALAKLGERDAAHIRVGELLAERDRKQERIEELERVASTIRAERDEEEAEVNRLRDRLAKIAGLSNVTPYSAI